MSLRRDRNHKYVAYSNRPRATLIEHQVYYPFKPVGTTNLDTYTNQNTDFFQTKHVVWQPLHFVGSKPLPLPNEISCKSRGVHGEYMGYETKPSFTLPNNTQACPTYQMERFESTYGYPKTIMDMNLPNDFEPPVNQRFRMEAAHKEIHHEGRANQVGDLSKKNDEYIARAQHSSQSSPGFKYRYR